MKILAAIIIPPHLAASGAVNAAMALSSALTKHCEIDVALMADEVGVEFRGGLRVLKRKAANPLDVTKNWLSNKYRTLFYRTDMASLVGEYDLVHIHNPIPALEMRRVAQACNARKIPYVVTTHGFVEVLGLQSAYHLGWLEMLGGLLFVTRPLDYVIKHAFKICCLAPQDRALLTRRGVPGEKLVVIPNGVNASSYEPPTLDERVAVCDKFGLPAEKNSDTPVCFFLANHTRNKGLDVLMEAFRGSNQPYCLIVGGKKRDYDYAAFQSGAKNHQRIVFTDALTDQEVRTLHHYTDLFVFPSRADTLPLVVLDAMAAGRPVLSTRVGGIPFQIDDTCGRLVEPNDPIAFRNAFEELFRDPVRLAAMGIAALEKVRVQFDWERSAEMTIDVYKQAVCDVSSTPR